METMRIGKRGNVRLDYNENHDEKTGEFTSGPGGNPGGGKEKSMLTAREHREEAVKHTKASTGVMREQGGGRYHIDMAQQHIKAAEALEYKAEELSNATGRMKLPGGPSGPVAVSIRALVKMGNHAAADKMLRRAGSGKQVRVHPGTKVPYPTEPGVAMRAEKGDKLAIAQMKAYKAAGAADNKALSAALKDKGKTAHDYLVEQNKKNNPNLFDANGNAKGTKAAARGMAKSEKRGTHITPLNPKQAERLVKSGSFSVLTPANPMSTANSSKDNARRMREGMKELNAKGAKYMITAGRYGDPEPGFMVVHDENFSKEDARQLGKKWGQTSVLHSEGGKGTIYHTNGKFSGLVQRSTGISFDPGAKDNYTGLHGGVKFSYNFPDESWEHPEKETP